MSLNPMDAPDAAPTSSNRTLRTCLIIGAGCAALLVIGLCVAVALGLPVFRSVLDRVDWSEAQALIEAIPDEMEGPIEETLPEELEELLPAPQPDIIFQGIEFSYPGEEDYGAVPAVLPAELDVEMFGLPERTVFTFAGYPLEDKFHEPQILIMKIEDLLVMSSRVAPGLDELRDVLQGQPRNLERVPFVMPSFNAAQMITTQVAYVPFESGQAVRFVTQYGQGILPINNHELFYAFQGLTDDGVYLVTAVLPVTHPSLPTDAESGIGEDYEQFAAGYLDALAEVKANLDSQNPESFTPGLNALDAMLGSLQIVVP